MKGIGIIICLLLTCRFAGAQDLTVITRVNVINMKDSGVLQNKSVWIEKGKIIGINNRVPGNNRVCRVIDGKGKFLIPGLMDMHAHFFYEQGDHRNTNEKELKTMLANGLTTVRIMAGHPTYLDAREKLRNGTWHGPVLFVVSPQRLGRWPWSPKFENFGIVNTPEEAREKVKSFKKEGYDEIKITFMVKKEVYDAIFTMN